MTDPELISLDKVGNRRDLLMDLVEHFSCAEFLADEFGEGQMAVLAKDAASTVKMLKRLLFRDISYVDERFLDKETRGLYAINLEGGRGTPLKHRSITNEPITIPDATGTSN
jgi:hypothetical protein